MLGQQSESSEPTEWFLHTRSCFTHTQALLIAVSTGARSREKDHIKIARSGQGCQSSPCSQEQLANSTYRIASFR